VHKETVVSQEAYTTAAGGSSVGTAVQVEKPPARRRSKELFAETLGRRLVRRVSAVPGARSLWRAFPAGPLALRVEYGISARPHYLYGLYNAASLAKQLGLPAISAIEFGVAGGRGLLAMEAIAGEVSRNLGVQIKIYGFDGGTGMPPPVDYRDVAHVWDQGFYKMDQEALKARLQNASLVIGEVHKTVPGFLANSDAPPIGFVAFDLDYYSSTRAALQVLEGPAGSHLPRTYCYFDDLLWPEIACHNEYIGELAAIRDFNLEHEALKVCPINMFSYMHNYRAPWHEQMYVFHDFHHPLYCVNITPKTSYHTDLPL